MNLDQLKEELAEVRATKKKKLRPKTAAQRRWAAARGRLGSKGAGDGTPKEAGQLIPVQDELAQLAERINGEHQECERHVQAGLRHAITAGHLLIKGKGLVGHGEWLPWLESHCSLSERLAQKYMRVARELDRLGQE